MIRYLATDSIVQVATPPGTGAIGIVRLSGEGSRGMLTKLLDADGARAWLKVPPRVMDLQRLSDPETGAPLDEALVVWFAAPRSFTGEEVVEIHAHGSPQVLESIIQACLKAGARLAERGEYSYRAFRNGKLDLSEAEGLLTLVNAGARFAQEGGLNLLQGGLRQVVEGLKRELVDLLSAMEVAFDYPEDHASGYDAATLIHTLEPIADRLGALLESYEAQKALVDGIRTVLVGAPNAGKSSLLNALVGIKRALVHATPGTTRDVVEAMLVQDGYKFVLFDTAGLNAEASELESAGFELAKRYMGQADLLIHVIDGSRFPLDADGELAGLCPELPRLTILNKADLGICEGAHDWLNLARIQGAIEISALTGEGMEQLHRALSSLAATVVARHTLEDRPYLTQRQYGLLQQALAEAGMALAMLREGRPEDLVALSLRESLTALLTITGEVYDETILEAVFSQFCVGK